MAGGFVFERHPSRVGPVHNCPTAASCLGSKLIFAVPPDESTGPGPAKEWWNIGGLDERRPHSVGGGTAGEKTRRSGVSHRAAVHSPGGGPERPRSHALGPAVRGSPSALASRPLQAAGCDAQNRCPKTANGSSVALEYLQFFS